MRRALALAVLAFASLHSTGTIAKRERDCIALQPQREPNMPFTLPTVPPSDQAALARLQRITDAAMQSDALRASAKRYADLRGGYRYA